MDPAGVEPKRTESLGSGPGHRRGMAEPNVAIGLAGAARGKVAA